MAGGWPALASRDKCLFTYSREITGIKKQHGPDAFDHKCKDGKGQTSNNWRSQKDEQLYVL